VTLEWSRRRLRRVRNELFCALDQRQRYADLVKVLCIHHHCRPWCCEDEKWMNLGCANLPRILALVLFLEISPLLNFRPRFFQILRAKSTTPQLLLTMPLPFLYEAAVKGVPWLPSFWNVAKVGALMVLIMAVKLYSRGAVNSAERKMHSKVVLITVRNPFLSCKQILTAQRAVHLE